MSDSIQRSAAVLYQMGEETPGLKESAQALVSDTMLWPALNGAGTTREEKEELIRTAPMLAGKEQLTAFVLLLLEQGTLDSLPAILSVPAAGPGAGGPSGQDRPGHSGRLSPGGPGRGL